MHGALLTGAHTRMSQGDTAEGVGEGAKDMLTYTYIYHMYVYV